MRLTARQVREALTGIEQSPWTRNWAHMNIIRRKLYDDKFKVGPSVPHPVPVRDRIRQWNIVAGDRIRLRGEKNGAISEVLGVNKYRNLVFLKAPQDQNAEGVNPQAPSVPYSQCQLYIGDREFPPAPGETEPRTFPVFASRIGFTIPKFAPLLGRFDWERFAVQTIPRLGVRHEKARIIIPWPEPDKPRPIPIEAYDTPEDVVKEITWKPSPLYYPPATRAKAKRLQDSYLHSIRPLQTSPTTPEYDPTTSAPMEYTLHDELSNPNSSAKKQYRARKRRTQLDLAQKHFMEAEVANLSGRTRREALVEAQWKWRERLRREDRERVRNRWVLRGGAADLKRKRQRKARKARREVEKLKNLTLEPGPNQVLPGTLPAV